MRNEQYGDLGTAFGQQCAKNSQWVWLCVHAQPCPQRTSIQYVQCFYSTYCTYVQRTAINLQYSGACP